MSPTLDAIALAIGYAVILATFIWVVAALFLGARFVVLEKVRSLSSRGRATRPTLVALEGESTSSAGTPAQPVFKPSPSSAPTIPWNRAKW